MTPYTWRAKAELQVRVTEIEDMGLADWGRVSEAEDNCVTRGKEEPGKARGLER